MPLRNAAVAEVAHAPKPAELMEKKEVDHIE